jgi:hypothetical protein
MAELLNWHRRGGGSMVGDAYTSKRRELVSRWTVFVSMRGEVVAGFDRGFVRKKNYRGLYKALDVLRGFVASDVPVPLARFEPEQEKFLAYREAIVTDMIKAMGLLSRRDWRSELDYSKERIREAERKQQEEAAPRAASSD